ncbi:MAG TPA: hypothetical protein VFZ52_05600 [Chryseolinea sp.]
MHSKIFRILTGLLLVSGLFCYGQPAKIDTAFLAQSGKKALAIYSTTIAHQSRLYNGSDYVIYFSREEEHPYFGTDDWVDGSIVYWDELYEDVPILFDLSVDQVIVEHERGNPIRLVPDKVERFTIMDHTFVRLLRDEKNKISDGFYDELYHGETTVYAKYFRTYRETLEAPKIIPHFDESVRYYLVKDGNFHVVKSKGSVLDVLADRKSELKNFLRKNRIRFKNDRENAIVRLAEFYDTLKD